MQKHKPHQNNKKNVATNIDLRPIRFPKPYRSGFTLKEFKYFIIITEPKAFFGISIYGIGGIYWVLNYLSALQNLAFSDSSNDLLFVILYLPARNKPVIFSA